MADQVREAQAAFEAWANDNAYGLKRLGDSYAYVTTACAWEAWQHLTASHAAEVEALRSALRAVLAVVEDPKNYRIWAADLLTCCYTAPAFDAARAALKGDKP